jgi:integrase
MACKVLKAKGGIHLGLRLIWRGIRSWETTRLEDTPENREYLEAVAKIISREIKQGIFDYLKHFPEGNRAHLFRQDSPRPALPVTVQTYCEKWIERRASQVRPQQVKCEKSYFTKHLLPAEIDGRPLGEFHLSALAIRHLQALQDYLRSQWISEDDEKETPYKAASVNKFIGAFQAMLKDARRSGAITVNLFDRVMFSKLKESDSESEIDPYLPEEREKILKGFRDHRLPYFAFVFHQFWTGCRPSESCALRRRDVDLAYGWERIEKSRVGGNEDGTKTRPSNRQIRLHDNLVDVLKDHVRFMVDPDAYLFTTPDRTPIDESNFYKREWLPMLRKLQIRPRPFYNTRHSYATFLLSVGARMSFIAAQTGDREETLRKHYAKYIQSLDPQRKWIEATIRKSEKSARKSEKSTKRGTQTGEQKMKKPLISQGLESGAGDRGRTDDLMLGKHTL